MKTRHGLALLLLVSGSLWAADVPDKINYQGVLRKGDESRFPAGIQNVKFQMYNQVDASAAVWGREIAVLLDSNGLFNVTLSDDVGSALTNGVLSRVLADSAQLFLGLSVGSGEEIKPRQELLSVPYAMLAGDVKTASSNLTVKGAITVDGMAMLTGGVTTVRLQIGDGVGLTFTNSRLRIADDLTVNGNAALNYNLNVIGNTTLNGLTVNEQTTLNGAATLNGKVTVTGEAALTNLTLTGTAKVFSPQTLSGGKAWKDQNRTQGAVVPDDWQILTNAASDGVLIISLAYELNTNSDGDDHKVWIYADFLDQGGSTNRTLDFGFHVPTIDAANGPAQKQCNTLPVLQHESVKLRFFEWKLHPGETDGKSTVEIQTLFVPFGSR